MTEEVILYQSNALMVARRAGSKYVTIYMKTTDPVGHEYFAWAGQFSEDSSDGVFILRLIEEAKK